MATEHIWSCKIGGIVPEGSSLNDSDMRDAVEREWRLLALGHDAQFNFSGMGHDLSEAERAVVENREPDFFRTGYAEERLHHVREVLRPDGRLPSYTAEEWLAVMMVKLGQAAHVLMSDPENPEPDIATGREVLLALAGAALDAWEALGAS